MTTVQAQQRCQNLLQSYYTRRRKQAYRKHESLEQLFSKWVSLNIYADEYTAIPAEEVITELNSLLHQSTYQIATLQEALNQSMLDRADLLSRLSFSGHPVVVPVQISPLSGIPLAPQQPPAAPTVEPAPPSATTSSVSSSQATAAPNSSTVKVSLPPARKDSRLEIGSLKLAQRYRRAAELVTGFCAVYESREPEPMPPRLKVLFFKWHIIILFCRMTLLARFTRRSTRLLPCARARKMWTI